jgi:hypothetical protein
MQQLKHIYEIRPSEYRRTFDLISNVLPFGRSGGYLDAATAVRQAKSYSGSHPAVIRVYDDAGNVIETQEHTGDFKE